MGSKHVFCIRVRTDKMFLSFAVFLVCFDKKLAKSGLKIYW